MTSIVSEELFTKVTASITRQVKKSQIPSTKHQTNIKFQAPMTETQFAVHYLR